MDRQELAALAGKTGGALVTTEKDLVRFPLMPAGGPEVCALRIETQVHDREALLGLVQAAVAGSVR